jgi:PPOX class probable F420-dependent enzyme
MTVISDAVREIIEKRTIGHLATLMPDGSPQSSPIWIDVDGDEILFNTAEGRAKPRNLRKDGRVALSFTDPDNPYSFVLVRGEVTHVTPEGADEHIDSLAKKYLDEDEYPSRQPGEERVIVRIKPHSITTGP